MFENVLCDASKEEALSLAEERVPFYDFARSLSTCLCSISAWQTVCEVPKSDS